MCIVSQSCYFFNYSMNSTLLNYSKFYYMFRELGFVGIEKGVRQTNIGRKETYIHFTDVEMKSQMSMACPKKPRS